MENIKKYKEYKAIYEELKGAFEELRTLAPKVDQSKYKVVLAGMKKAVVLVKETKAKAIEEATALKAKKTAPVKNISASVGVGGKNIKADVLLIQQLLNKKGYSLVEDGLYGRNTGNAITAFQKTLGFSRPDGRVDVGGGTWKALSGGSSTTVSSNTSTETSPEANSQEAEKPSGKYFSHPDASKVKLTKGGNAVKLNADAEHLLKSVLAAAGVFSAHYTSTLRTYADQARINYEQNSESQIKQWYGSEVHAAWVKYKREGRSTAEYAQFLEARDKKRGRVISKHLSNLCIDVTPVSTAYANQLAKLKPVSGSGVKTYLEEKGCVHTEFTFPVTNGSASSASASEPQEEDSSSANNNASSQETVTASKQITASVGVGGKNIKADVLLIQQLLNKKGYSLVEDGFYGRNTGNAIAKFQQSLGFSKPDGRVDVGGGTWKALTTGASAQDTAQDTTEETPNTSDSSASTTTSPTDSSDVANDPALKDALSPASKISASVGTNGGKNKPEDVLCVQILLQEFGYKVERSGECDKATIDAILDFQKRYVGASKPDGRIDAGGKSWSTLIGIGRISGKLEEMGNKFGVEPAVILAIQAIESGGNGYFSDGRPKILFEGHIFWSQLKKAGKNPQDYVRGNENILFPKWDKTKYLGGVKEYDRLAQAKKIDKVAALKSASWGEFQIMGFNHKVVGYNDVETFVDAMHIPGGNSLEAVMNFLKNNNLLRHVQGESKNWAALAKGYNGPAYAQNQYDVKLEKAYNRYKANLAK